MDLLLKIFIAVILVISGVAGIGCAIAGQIYGVRKRSHVKTEKKAWYYFSGGLIPNALTDEGAQLENKSLRCYSCFFICCAVFVATIWMSRKIFD